MANNDNVDFEELKVANPLTALNVNYYGAESMVHCLFLRKLGVQVREVESGLATLTLCESGAFDIVCVNMDLQYGLQIVTSLREMRTRSKLIGFTCQEREKIQGFMLAGLDYCMEKPVRVESLAAVLREIDEDY
ncbi:hypothetical protein AQUCO_01300728v1 [Aquilegia coerulea]|uniref:Response regulatory domain-containing protein n=1 Tax=Aquilegia coerulea TaxID=218851 RepID=A0A2G5E345_AQUCA|nr:hypothetical protein AQUCO_01300728v1 [Aquilegia coerulea]